MSITEIFKNILNIGVPILALYIIIPIIVGAVSSSPTLGVAIVFPVLLPLLGEINIHILSIIVSGIVMGYVGSPLHLCLILTNEYYKSDINKVSKYLIPSATVLYIIALVYHLIFSGLFS
jgi:hypothetical protein